MPSWRRAGTNSSGCFSTPTVMAVRSSRYSTGFEDSAAQAPSSASMKNTGTLCIRMHRSIPGRELEPINQLFRHGIIFHMTKRYRHRLGNFLRILPLLAAFWSGPQSVFAEEIATADHVVVHKAQRKLYLYHGTQLLGEYRVALGLSPVGQKERERDFRTPEGRYFLSRR